MTGEDVDTSSSEDLIVERRGLEKWVREESFWKDVTTRTLSGLVVVFVVWVVGVLTGVFNSAGALEGLMRLFELVVIVSGTIALILGWRLAGRGRSAYAASVPSTRSRWTLRLQLLPIAGVVLFVAVDFVMRFLGFPIL